ncbi:MAG TPA: ABC transporter substrate-binding protein [Actinomycetota bacterium]|nr:ABC transporter substrate-binding protein [Actinomycetota bacterium]
MGRSRIGVLRAAAVALVALGLVAAACTPGTQENKGGGNTIVFATQGLGSEGDATKAAVSAFEKQNPGMHVQILTLSPDANTAYQQLTQRFVAGGSTPDVITSDVIWPATFAKAGWLAPLDSFGPDTSSFFPAQVEAGTYNGKIYAIPWFINAEGVYYRTDLIPNPPKTPEELVADAKSAMQEDPSIKYGLAFSGDKYEGAVTTFINFLGGFGGQLDPANLDTPQNVQALQFMQDLIYKDKVAPQAVTGWEEPNVESAFMSGQAAFAMNWPYVFAEAEASGSKVKGKTGWIPFPSQTGQPQAALGGSMLAVNANSTHQDLAWKFIQFLTEPQTQIDRAVTAGDPPAVQAAYTDALYSKAPYFKDEVPVFNVTSPRPVTPNYPKISDALQTMLSSVLSNQTSAQQALSQTAPQVKSLVGG